MFLFIAYAQTVAVVQGAFPRKQRALACSAGGYMEQGEWVGSTL